LCEENLAATQILLLKLGDIPAKMILMFLKHCFPSARGHARPGKQNTYGGLYAVENARAPCLARLLSALAYPLTLGQHCFRRVRHN
jgi:hypothetical protein